MKTKAEYIATKYGFAKGVASDAYLLAFDSAAAKCDPRYGWKKGSKGVCERVTPQDDPKEAMQRYYNSVIDAADEGEYKNQFGTEAYIPLGTQKFIQSRTLNEDKAKELLNSARLTKNQKVEMLYDVASGDMLSDEAKVEAYSYWDQIEKTGKAPLNAFGTTDFISSAKNAKKIQDSEEFGMRYWGVPYSKKQAEGIDDWEFDIEDLGWSNFIKNQRDERRSQVSLDWGRYKAGNRGIGELEGELLYSFYKPENAPIRRRDSSRAKCDLRYGWKRGGKGCERIKPKEKAALKQEGQGKLKGKGGLLAIGGGALAIGAVGGLIGGMAIANGTARKYMDIERQEVRAAADAHIEEQVKQREFKLVQENQKLEEELGRVNSVVEEAAKREAELIQKVADEEEGAKQAIGLVKKLSQDLDKSKAELDSVSKSLKEKEAEAEDLKKRYGEVESAPQRLQDLTIELEQEKGKSENLSAKVADQEKTLKEAEEAAKKASEQLTVSTEALKQSQSALKQEKAKFDKLSKAISDGDSDLKTLTKKVKTLKDTQEKAVETEKELAIANEKISTLDATTRNLNDSITTLQSERADLSEKLKQADEAIKALRSSTTVDQDKKEAEIKKLNAALSKGTKDYNAMREAEAKATGDLLEANRQLASELTRANTLQQSILDKDNKIRSLEKELGVTRDTASEQMEAIHKRYQEQLAKVYEEKAQILEASPETFNQKKLRRSSDAQLSGLLTYSIEGGISDQSLEADSPLWKARPDLREKAVRKATDRIVDLEEERIQAELAKTMAKTIKEMPLAMSGYSGEKEVTNIRKRTRDLAEATALARSIADRASFIGTNSEGVPYSRKSMWKEWANWSPKDADSPTHRLFDNEAVLAEAKLRDIYVFTQAKKIRANAQEEYKAILASDMFAVDKAQRMRAQHTKMMEEIKAMRDVATSSREDLFAAIKRDIEGRRDSREQDEGRAKKERNGLLQGAAIIGGGILAGQAIISAKRLIEKRKKNARCKGDESWVDNPNVKNGGYCRSSKELQKEKQEAQELERQAIEYARTAPRDGTYTSFGEQQAAKEIKDKMTDREQALLIKSGKEKDSYISDLTRGSASKDREGVNSFWEKKIKGENPLNDFGTSQYLSPRQKQWAIDKGLEPQGSKLPNTDLIDMDIKEMGLEKTIQLIKDEDSILLFPNPREDLEFKRLENIYYGKKKDSLALDAKAKGRMSADEKVAKVMGEFKSGKLKSSSGDPVEDRKQAIAIALSEAGIAKKKKESKGIDANKRYHRDYK